MYTRYSAGVDVEMCPCMSTCSDVMGSGDCKTIKLNNFARNDRIPIVIYADFECILKTRNSTMQQNLCATFNSLSLTQRVNTRTTYSNIKNDN